VKNTKTVDDYEALRNYATGGEAQDGAEVELAAFVARGTAAWIRTGNGAKNYRRERPVQGEAQRLLAILLANMIESRGELA